MADQRAKRIFDKEPATIARLDRLGPDDTLWDIGANVGVYTVYAAMKRGCQVLAFEPGAANYWTLNRTIEINRLDDRVSAYCIAVARSSGADRLFMGTTKAGGAASNYGEPIDFRGRPFKESFRQGAISYSIDDLAKILPPPSHIKLDVDGLEVDILRGAGSVLRNRRLRSVIVEIDLAQQTMFSDIAELMRAADFVLTGQAGNRTEGIVNGVFDRRDPDADLTRAATRHHQ